jgi:hypothetical protein
MLVGIEVEDKSYSWRMVPDPLSPNHTFVGFSSRLIEKRLKKKLRPTNCRIWYLWCNVGKFMSATMSFFSNY